MAHVITENCCDDRSCVAVCPVDSIHPTLSESNAGEREMLFIDPRTCIDCGNCVVECPVGAIYHEDDLPENMLGYVRVNADFFADQPAPGPVPRKTLPIVATERASRIAVIGSGPAGCYAAASLLDKAGRGLEIDIFDRLPTPWGLARSGVAPDHLETKAVIESFARRFNDPRIHFYLNVEVGSHVSVDELLGRYDAVVIATGAPGSRSLGISGEDLAGSHTAREFVAWYNGHPDFANLSFDLSGSRAVLVGNGNVALDVARVLMMDRPQLTRTDVAPAALEKLADSNIREVVILGRRGPAQAACTTPELRALGRLPGVDIVVDTGDVGAAMVAGNPHSSIVKAKLQTFAGYAGAPRSADKAIQFRFFSTPLALEGSTRVGGVRIGRSDISGSAQEPELLPTGLFLRANGYRGVRVDNLPFDEEQGVIPNLGGRVVDPAVGSQVPGVYVVGWAKRGPQGFLGTNRTCSEETVTHLLTDVEQSLPRAKHERRDLDVFLRSRQPELVSWAGWLAIDRVEYTRGREEGRPRTKVTDWSELVNVAREGLTDND